MVLLLLITFMEALGTQQCDWVLVMSGILNIISISSILMANHRNYDSIKTSNFHPAPYISNWHTNPFANYVFWLEIQKLSHLNLRHKDWEYLVESQRKEKAYCLLAMTLSGKQHPWTMAWHLSWTSCFSPGEAPVLEGLMDYGHSELGIW